MSCPEVVNESDRKKEKKTNQAKSALEERGNPGVTTVPKRSYCDDSRPNIIVEVMYKKEKLPVEIHNGRNQQ